MQMTERGNTEQFKHGNMKPMKHANDKKGKYWAMSILNIWTKFGPRLIIFKHGNMCQPHDNKCRFKHENLIIFKHENLIRFKHGNMCQPHHGTQPPLCRPHTIPHQKHLLQI